MAQSENLCIITIGAPHEGDNFSVIVFLQYIDKKAVFRYNI